jgi:hypothetical protein
MDGGTTTIWEKRLMKTLSIYPSLRDGMVHFLTPPVYKQAHRAWHARYASPRWNLQALVWTALTMAWSVGDSQEVRFATARATYVASHQHSRRPGTTLAGFLAALAKLPMRVLRVFAAGVRQLLNAEWVEAARFGGYVPLACDGTRLECPRAASLQRHLGEAGKRDSAPMLYLTTLTLLPWGIPWAWRWGKGTANEHAHLRHMLPHVPQRSLLVGDAFYVGYELLSTIVQARASFVVRLSSRIHLYTTARLPLKRFREGLVYYWPQHLRDRGAPPLHFRVVRVRGRKADVWLLTNVLDRRELSHAQIAQLYRWRWRNEGLFRVYKRMLGKVKLQSRTIPLVHREAESSLLALQMLLAADTPPRHRGQRLMANLDSPRRALLRVRGAIVAALRTLGPRQFAQYQRMLQEVRSQERLRTSSRVRQAWPRKKPYKPPGPPQFREMSLALRTKLAKWLPAA